MSAFPSALQRGDEQSTPGPRRGRCASSRRRADVRTARLVRRICPRAGEGQRYAAGEGRVASWRRARSLSNAVRKRLHIPSGWVLNLTLSAACTGTSSGNFSLLDGSSITS